MKTKIIVVKNPKGLHARPSCALVKSISSFESNINIKKENIVANARSILELLSLCVEQGNSVVVEADGKDEEEAINTITELFDSNFGE